VHTTTFSDAIDYVRASHDGYRPHAEHTRAVAYLKPEAVVVLDRISATEPCTVDLTWQTMPGRTFDGVVAARPGATRRDDSGPYSPRYTWLEHGPRAVFSARGRDVVFATVLPLAGRPEVEIRHEGTTTTVIVGGRRIVERW
jgi:hypothetical protein